MAVPVPSTLDTILEELKLEPSQVQEVPGTIVAVVHNDWLHYLFKNGVVPSTKQLNVPHACWEKLPGRPAYGRVESPWKRVEIEIMSKPTSGKIIVPTINPKWLMKGDLGFMEFMQCLAKQNYLIQWEQMYQKHATLLMTNRNARQAKQGSSMELEESLKALFNCPIFKTCQRDRPQELDKTTTSGMQTTPANYQQHQEHPNMVPVVCIISSAKSLFIIRHCVEHTLQDCITFSPAMLGNSYAKPLFVIYQILKAFDFCHQQGVPCGQITLRDFTMDKNLWVQFRGPKWNDFIQKNCCVESKVAHDSASSDGSSAERLNEPECATETPANDPFQTLPELVLSWVKGELSNFDYLMILNSLAGRHASNPNHYPVLPWVMDFTRPDGGYRDLSKSKYRLTKGDHQLDFMYESSLNQSSSPTDSALQSPHHISDVLSEITYYVYTARRTPKSVLCAHVRSTWVPNEYPSSIQRLQEWTPDECIPEFFTDPEIFRSVHEDLLDLEVPTWSSGPEDFIAKHRAILESDYVSDRLHRWIDLTFGFKLSGGAAIRAKNVCLHLVDQHTHPTSHGAVQLFNVPHPRRLTPSPYLSPSPPTIVRKQPRLDGSVAGRSADIEIVQPEIVTVGNEQTTRASEFTTTVVAAREATPEITLTSGQPDGTGGSLTATEGSSISPAMEVVSESNLEVSVDTIETINSIVSSGNGSKAIDMPPQAPSVPLSLAQTADESSLLKNPIKKLPFFRSKADALTETKPSIPRPEQMRISLPDDYEPLAALNQLESLYSFSSKALQGLPANRGKPTPADCSIHLLGQDMHVMGCLIVEMFLAPKLRMLHQNAPLLERWKILRRVFDTDWLDLPRPVRQVTRLLLELDTKPNLGDITDHLYRQPTMGLPYPTANMLLQPAAEVLSFPSYMPNVYKLLSDLKTAGSGSTGKMDLKKHSVAKIHHVSRHLPKIVRQLTAEGRELLFPYLLELFESVDTALYACLLLLTKVAQFIGPQQATRKLLPCLSQVYDSEFTSPNFMLLFHQSFLAKLIVWFGLGPFLSNIIAYVVDAVTGLKECPEFRPAVDDPISIIADDKKVRPTSMGGGSLDLINLDDEVDLQVTNDVEIALDQGDGESESSSSEEDVPSSSSRKDSESTDTSSLGPTSHTENQEDTNPDDGKSEKPSNGNDIDQVSTEDSDGQRTSELSSEETNKSGIPTDALLPTKSDGTPEETSSKSDEAFPVDIPADNSDGTLSQEAIVTEAVKKEADPDPSVTVGVETDPPVEEPTEDPIQEYLMSSLTKGRMSSLGNLPPGSRLTDVAVDSVMWLSRRLGPALTVTHLTKRLLKALKTCFMGGHLLSYFDFDSDSDSSDDEYGVYIERRTVLGDSNAKAVLGCLTDIAVLYGDQFIFKRYLPYIQDTVCSVRRKINLKAEANLVSCIVLLRHLIPFITDSQLMDKLTFIFRKLLQPLVNIVQSCQLSFPSGAQGRAVICYKLVDVMTTIGLRIGREMAREHMTGTLQHFFVCFELVHGDRSSGAKPCPDMERRYNQFSHSTDSEDMYCEIKVDSQTNQYKIGTPTKLENLHGEMARSPNAFSSRISDNLHVDVLEKGHSVDPEIMTELRETFSPEMANTAYIPLCRLTGSIHMERILYNHDLIWRLSNQHEKALAAQRAAAISASTEVGDQGEAIQRQTSWFVDIGALDNTEDLLDPGNSSQNPNAQVIGNRIDITNYSSDSDSAEEETSQNVARSTNAFKSKRQNPSLLMGKSKRQLKGEWLAHWENFCDNAENSSLNYNQIKLQTFVGHTGGIKALYGMDNENSFMSASKDKTVKLWSLRNQGDGSGKSSCRYTYSHHRKGVFSVTFLESQRLVASCDGNVHLWDPFTGAQVHRYDLAKFVPSLLVKMPSPSPVLVVAMADTSVRLIDTRSSVVQQELKVASGTLGLIRCLAVSPGSSTLGVGLSSGVLSMVDLSSGLLLGGWRAHDGEVMQIKACSGNRFLTSSVDHTIALWREDGTKACTFRGASEPVHCMSVCNGQIVSATTSNRIGIHTTMDQQASFSSHRVRSDLVKGMVTTLDVMPLNRLFLVGSDSGLVTLLA